MWRWMRWVLAGMLVVALIGVIDILRIDHKARAARREQEVRYGKMLEQVRKEYPLGISVADVTLRLREKHIPYSQAGKELLLPLGDDPSYVWYCNNWITYAGLVFDGDVANESPVFKLQSIRKEIIGGTCL